MSMNTIILLNGVGSAGKSSIAKALQSITEQPFLHVEMDGFLEMMPAKFRDHPDGLRFETRMDQGSPVTTVDTGKVARRVLNGMRLAVAALASSGNNMIVDEVIFGNKSHGASHPLAEYQAMLKPYTFYIVGVFASLEVLERRESDRGDRKIGLSRWQYDRVHEDMEYDFSVQTDDRSPLACAEQIKAKLDL